MSVSLPQPVAPGLFSTKPTQACIAFSSPWFSRCRYCLRSCSITPAYHGDAVAPGLSDRNWAPISLLFLVAEMVTIAAMGPLIQWIAWLNAAKANLQNAYLLAFVAPLPLWLSSLGLIVPNFFFTSALAVAAMVMACFIIYHGVATLLQISEDVVAGSIAYGIMACGMVAWALLLIAVFPVS